MKNEKQKPETKGPDDAQAAEKSAIPKKTKKNTPTDEALTAVPKVKKAKPEKEGKEKGEQKEKKASKDDKVTKFLVSMKKSVRKNIKKEAAEAGVSMNEYIVLAVEAKLSQDALK